MMTVFGYISRIPKQLKIPLKHCEGSLKDICALPAVLLLRISCGGVCSYGCASVLGHSPGAAFAAVTEEAL